MNTCENCGTKHEVKYGSGRFCSTKCSRGFSTKTKRKEINAKVSNKRKGSGVELLIKVCQNPNCLKKYRIHPNKKDRSKFCSNLCKYSVPYSEDSKKRISESIKKRVDLRIHKGWSSRKIISYPERFFIKVLKENNISFEFNYKIAKKDLGINDNNNYFLDFYFPDIRLDLEIDGKQHDYADRRISDNIRDSLLEKINIIVYRIKWKSINNDLGKDNIKKEIDSFLAFYKKIKAASSNLAI